MLYYRKMGAGPVLVLLHGFPENSTLWRNVWDKLSASYTLIIPDFPGSGNSSFKERLDMADMATCVYNILIEENISRAVVAGHSMGGYAALAFAARHPEMVAGLSLVHSTPVADDEEKRKTRIKSIEVIQKGGKRAFISQMVPNLFSTDSKEKLSTLIDNLIEEGVAMSDESLINYYQAMLGRQDHTASLEGFQFPVQWILGTEDAIIPYKKILMFCTRSAINFVSFYRGCGHMSMYEAPERLATDLDDFVKYCCYNQEEHE